MMVVLGTGKTIGKRRLEGKRTPPDGSAIDDGYLVAGREIVPPP